MATFEVKGGTPLEGEIRPQGAKNEALQVLCATLLTPEKVIIHNIPAIVDVLQLIELFEKMGVIVHRLGEGSYSFEAKEIDFDYLQSDDYRDLLTRWQTEFAPLSPEEPLDEHFVEALHMMAVVDDLIDCLAFGPTSKKAAAAKRLLDGQLLPMVESRLNTLDREEAA